MILWAFKETTEGNEESWRPRAHRLTFQVGRWFFGLVWQHQPRESAEWYDSHVDVWQVSLARAWRWGVYHMYYDGPHCVLALGPLRFQWRPRDGWCEKCMPSNKDGAQ